MPYDPNIHHRRSIRLPQYDYAQPGAYFVTICTHERECVLGDIVHGRMDRYPFLAAQLLGTRHPQRSRDAAHPRVHPDQPCALE